MLQRSSSTSWGYSEAPVILRWHSSFISPADKRMGYFSAERESHRWVGGENGLLPLFSVGFDKTFQGSKYVFLSLAAPGWFHGWQAPFYPACILLNNSRHFSLPFVWLQICSPYYGVVNKMLSFCVLFECSAFFWRSGGYFLSFHSISPPLLQMYLLPSRSKALTLKTNGTLSLDNTDLLPLFLPISVP